MAHTPSKNILDILCRDLNLSTRRTEVLFMLPEFKLLDICLSEICAAYIFERDAVQG